MEEAEELTPTEMERLCIRVSEVEDGNRITLEVGWIDDGRFPELRPSKWRRLRRIVIDVTKRC